MNAQFSEDLSIFLNTPFSSNSMRKVSFKLSLDDYNNLRFLASRSKVTVSRFASNLFLLALSESLRIASQLDSSTFDSSGYKQTNLFDDSDLTEISNEFIPLGA